MTKNLTLVLISFTIAVVSVLAGLAIITYNTLPVFGSVSVTDEYQSTSTAPSAAYGARTTAMVNIRLNQSPVSGSLGSVVVTGPNTGVLNFYDATTTNINLRTGNTPTSTLLIASLPSGMATGTYQFDVEYTTGLTWDLYSGVMPTTTITYR